MRRAGFKAIIVIFKECRRLLLRGKENNAARKEREPTAGQSTAVPDVFLLMGRRDNPLSALHRVQNRLGKGLFKFAVTAADAGKKRIGCARAENAEAPAGTDTKALLRIRAKAQRKKQGKTEAQPDAKALSHLARSFAAHRRLSPGAV